MSRKVSEAAKHTEATCFKCGETL